MKTQTTSQIINTIKVIALALLLALGISSVSADHCIAGTWCGPHQAPPNGNVDAPIHIGTAGQIKKGGVTLGDSLENTSGVVGLFVKKGNVGIGEINPPPYIPGSSILSGKLHVSNVLDANLFKPALSIFTYGVSNASSYAIFFKNSNSNQGWGIETAYDGSFRIGSPDDSTNNTYPLYIKPNRNIGIKTTDPQAALDINGSFRLRGNGAAAGKVLTSDADGTGTWQAAAGGGIGVGQTWQIVTRTSGTTYTNTTGRPIVVNVGQYLYQPSSYKIFVGGIQVANATISGTWGNESTISAIVPNGQSYVITGTAGYTAVELR